MGINKVKRQISMVLLLAMLLTSFNFTTPVYADSRIAGVTFEKVPIDDTPTNQNVIIELNGSDALSGVKAIYQVTGETLKELKAGAGKVDFTIPDNGTYQFLVEDNAGNKTGKEVTINNIDRVVPAVKSKTSGNTDFTNQNIVLTIGGTDDHTGLRSISLSGSGKPKETKEITGLDGKVTFTVGDSQEHIDGNNVTYTIEVEDQAGNIVTDTIDVGNINKTLPVITETSRSTIESVWTNQPVTVEVESNKGALNVNPGDGTDLETSTGKYTFDKNGEYTFESTDKWGNKRELSVTVENIDTVKPVVTSDNNDYDWRTEDIGIKLNYTDEGGSKTKTREYAIVYGEGQPAENDWRESATEISDNIIIAAERDDIYIHYRVEDNAGNESQGKFGPYKLDKTLPTYDNKVKTAYSLNEWYNSPVNILVDSITDPGSQIDGVEGIPSGVAKKEFTINTEKDAPTTGYEALPEDGIITVTNERDNNYVHIRVTDTAGLEKIETMGPIRIDTTDPTVASDNEDSNWKVEDIEANLTYADSGGYALENKQYAVTNTEETPTEWQDSTTNNQQIVINTERDDTYIHHRAVDIAGNEIINKFGPFKLDKKAPVYQVAVENEGAKNDDEWYNEDLVINVGSIVDPQADGDIASGLNEQRYKLNTNNTKPTDGYDYLAGDGIVILDNEGADNFIHISINDIAGNEEYKQLGPYKLDKTAPTHPILGIDDEDVIVTNNAEDSLSGVKQEYVRLVFNADTAWKKASNIPFNFMPNGDYLVESKSIDNADNESEVFQFEVRKTDDGIIEITEDVKNQDEIKEDLKDVEEAVKKAEEDKTIESVDDAESILDEVQNKIDELEDTPQKEELQDQLDDLKDRLEKVKEDIAEKLVEEAESLVDDVTKDPTDDDKIKEAQDKIDEAREEVGKLEPGDKKDELNGRLDKAQDDLDNAKEIYIRDKIKDLEEKIDETEENPTDENIKDAEDKIKEIEDEISKLPDDTGDSTTKEDLEKELGDQKDRLEDIKEENAKDALEDAKDAVDKAEQDPTDENIKDAEDKLEDAQKEIDNLEDGDVKDELQKELDELEDKLDKIKEDKAEKAVEEAEKAVDEALEDPTRDNIRDAQDKIDEAQDEVNKLPEGDKKDELQDRLDDLQDKLDEIKGDLDKIIDEIGKDIDDLDDLDNVDEIQDKIDSLPEGDDKDDLQDKLDEKVKAIESVDDARKAVEKAEGDPTKENIRDAQDKIGKAREDVGKIDEGTDKEDLNNQLDDLQDRLDKLKDDHDKLVDEIEKEIEDLDDLDNAGDIQDKIDSLPDGDDKDDLQDKLDDKVKDLEDIEDAIDNAEEKVENAEDDKTQDSKDEAQDALDDARDRVDKLPDGDIKDDLNDKLDDLQDRLDDILINEGDTDLELDYDRSDKWRRYLKVDVKAVGEYKEIILPNGAKVYDREFSHIIREDGVYEFTIVPRKGEPVTRIVRAKKIDTNTPQISFDNLSDIENIALIVTDDKSGIEEVILPSGKVVKELPYTFNGKDEQGIFTAVDLAGNKVTKEFNHQVDGDTVINIDGNVTSWTNKDISIKIAAQNSVDGIKEILVDITNQLKDLGRYIQTRMSFGSEGEFEDLEILEDGEMEETDQDEETEISLSDQVDEIISSYEEDGNMLNKMEMVNRLEELADELNEAGNEDIKSRASRAIKDYYGAIVVELDLEELTETRVEVELLEVLDEADKEEIIIEIEARIEELEQEGEESEEGEDDQEQLDLIQDIEDSIENLDDLVDIDAIQTKIDMVDNLEIRMLLQAKLDERVLELEDLEEPEEDQEQLELIQEIEEAIEEISELDEVDAIQALIDTVEDLDIRGILQAKLNAKIVEIEEGEGDKEGDKEDFEYDLIEEVIISENGELNYKILNETNSYDGNIEVTRIDKIKPELDVTVNGKEISYKATDNLSGIRFIYLPNGEVVEKETDQILSVDGKLTMTGEGQFIVAAEDFAGNVKEVEITLTLETEKPNPDPNPNPKPDPNPDRPGNGGGGGGGGSSSGGETAKEREERLAREEKQYKEKLSKFEEYLPYTILKGNDLKMKDVKITGYDKDKVGRQEIEVEIMKRKTKYKIEVVSLIDNIGVEKNVPDNHWGKHELINTIRKGYIQGSTNGDLMLNGTLAVTDGFVAYNRLLLAKGLNGTELSRDVVDNKVNLKDSWYTKGVKSIVRKYSKQDLAKFNLGDPNRALLREEIAQIIYNSLKGELKTNRPMIDYEDLHLSSNKEAIEFVTRAGIIVGDGKGKVNPKGELTRAEFMAILNRLDNLVK